MTGTGVRNVGPLLVVYLLVGCRVQSGVGSAATPGPSAVAAPSDAREGGEARRVMCEQLVTEVRKYHLFSNAWPEKDWLRQLPALRDEVIAASSQAELLVALARVGNSLRDGHLAFTPTGGWKNRGIAVLPVTFVSVGSSSAPRFFVQRADPDTGLEAGDELLEYDSIRAVDLLDHFRFSIARGSPGARTHRLTELLQWRWTQENPGILGSKVDVRVRRGERNVNADVIFEPNAPPPPSTETEPECAAPLREYGASYSLVRTSERLCLYRSTEAAFAAYPIVRQYSFHYGGNTINYGQLAQDREMVRTFLRELPSLSGILLDVRDNGGGNHAALFLPWYLGDSFGATTEWVSLHAELDDRQRLHRTLQHGADVEEYVRRAEAGERWWTRPFRCPASECPNQTDIPLARVPVALLVGPGCRSACDDFFEVWTQEGAGPTVGAPPAAMVTALRYPLPVRLGNQTIGELTIALSGTRASENDAWLQGSPKAVDHEVEVSWPPREYERRILTTAIAALERTPKAVSENVAPR